MLERPFGGLFAMFADDHETDLEAVTAELGQRWELERILVKPYASGGTTHPVADALLRGRWRTGVGAKDVAALTISLTHDSFHHNGWRLEPPITANGAQLNVAYVAAVALLDGAVLVPQFSEARVLRGEDVWSLIQRTTVRHDPGVDELARRSGTPRATRIAIAVIVYGQRRRAGGAGGGLDKVARCSERGDPGEFHGLLDDLVGPARASEIEHHTLALAELPDARRLVELLRRGVASP